MLNYSNSKRQGNYTDGCKNEDKNSLTCKVRKYGPNFDLLKKILRASHFNPSKQEINESNNDKNNGNIKMKNESKDNSSPIKIIR